MTLSTEERSFVTTAIISVALGVGVLGAAVAIFVNKAASAGTGDTPVILVGGSLSFKAGSQKGTLSWTPVPATCTSACTEYFLDPGYSVSTIALKDSSVDDGTDAPVPADNNPAKDKIRADISNASTWEIDEYATFNSSAEAQVASITPNATQIHVKVVAPAALCLKTPKRLVFSPTGVCPAPDGVAFTRVALQIDNGPGTTVASGSLSCVDDSADDNPNKCRIAFRGSN